MDNIHVLIADNQSFTRVGVTTVLSGHLNQAMTIDDAKTREELLEKLANRQPHILIIDYDLIDFAHITELGEIRKKFPHIGILVITDNQAPDDIIKVLDCGITNYILKSCKERELLEAFDAAISSRKYFSSQVLDVLLEKKNIIRNSPNTSGKLTNAETEIVRLISLGLTTKEIALHRKLSYHTIITHRKNIFRKLGISNSSELIMYAIRTGIADNTEYYI